MKANFEISIREETFEKLNLGTNSKMHRFLKESIDDFLYYNFSAAITTLFKLLYEDDKYTLDEFLKKLHFTLYSETSFDSTVEYLFITEQEAKLIANELQFQYVEAHPNFLKVNAQNYPGCEEELRALSIQLEANHPVLFYNAVKSIQNLEPEEVAACIKLLLSEKEATQLEGLEKMKHNRKYQKLLLPYAKKIGLLLQAYSNVTKQLVKAAQAELNTSLSPFAPLSELRDKLPETAPVATTNQEEPKCSPENSAPVCANTIDNKQEKSSYLKEYSIPTELKKFTSLSFNMSEFGEFWNQMKQFRATGIDLNIVVDNMDSLLAYSAAYDVLQQATQSLISAEKDFDVAKDNFSKENIHSLHTFVAAARALQDAKNFYDVAFVKVVEICENYPKN